MNFRLKDPGSAITHFIGMVLSVVAGTEPAQPTTPFILLNM